MRDHKHGSRYAYVHYKCRHPDCVKANRTYNQKKRDEERGGIKAIINMGTAWMSRALCKLYPDDLWFGSSSEREFQSRERVREAKDICNRCPVEEECLVYALQAKEEHNIWGGHTDKERRKMLNSGVANSIVARYVHRQREREQGAGT